MMKAQADPRIAPSEVLAKAVVRAADWLRISQKDLAASLGVSAASTSR